MQILPDGNFRKSIENDSYGIFFCMIRTMIRSLLGSSVTITDSPCLTVTVLYLPKWNMKVVSGEMIRPRAASPLRAGKGAMQTDPLLVD
jgi:hypothetical protein